jgi:ATP-binding cassette subfamily F protein 3
MADLIQLRGACKGYEGRALIENADMAIGEGDRAGLIGRNGCGKSTLCRILLGEEPLDEGELWRHPSLRLGYLRQHDPFLEGESALEFLMRDSSQPEWRCGQVAGRLGITEDVLRAPVLAQSGGWRTRIKLAALGLSEANLLVLDEPTNFVDLRTRVAVESFLAGYRGAYLIVSHDRAFLKNACTVTIELARAGVRRFEGDIDAFFAFDEKRRVQDARTNELVRAERRRLQAWVDAHRARASSASQAQSKLKQIERLREREIASAEPRVRLTLPAAPARKGTALRCTDLGAGYPGKTVLSGVDLEVAHGSRVAVLGDNGQGKTTFLRTVSGSLEAIAGAVWWSAGCTIGTYAQHVYASLPSERTVLDYLHACSDPTSGRQRVLDVAGGFLFSGTDLDKPIGVLSGGERARLCLAGVLLTQSTILVLDEPVTHLDAETAEALAQALAGYEGTVLFASHDRRFTERLATRVFEVGDGRIRDFPGDYGLYLHRIAKEAEEASAREVLAEARSRRRDQKPSSNPRRPNPQRVAAELATVEERIERGEARRGEIEEQLARGPDFMAARALAEELAAVQRDLEDAEHRWLELQELASG